MIVCTRCGGHNADATEFCGACGFFLEWQEAPAEVEVLAPTPGPAVEQPVVLQPTDQRLLQRSAPTLTEQPPLNPGDLICGDCGTGNAPTRKFCRHCGHSLAEARTVKLRWWQRLLPKRGKRKRRRAGARPKSRGGRPWRTVARWFSRAILAVLTVAALLYALVPAFRTGANHQAMAAKNWVQGWFTTKNDPIHPTKVTATAAIPDHDAEQVADTHKNTFWAAPITPAPALTFTFDHPVEIRQAIFRSGDPANFESTYRPTKLHLVYNTARSFDVTLNDTSEPQTVDIGESAGATNVQIFITGLHPSLQGNTVAISEIELFGKP
jgi:ribosomal protein L40E